VPNATKSTPRQSPQDMSPGFARVVSAFATDKDVTFGRMFASMGLTVHGKIFAMHVKGAFVVKLPADRVAELVRLEHVAHFDPGHGRLMKEWIAVRGDDASWIGLAREARRFVGAPAKPRSARPRPSPGR
jgi:hypothetical protein